MQTPVPTNRGPRRLFVLGSERIPKAPNLVWLPSGVKKSRRQALLFEIEPDNGRVSHLDRWHGGRELGCELERSRLIWQARNKEDGGLKRRVIMPATADCVTESVRGIWERMAEKMAGPFLGDMLTSRSATEKYLQHENAKVRLAALFICKNHWGITGPSEAGPLIRTLENIARQDSDAEVRGIAMLYLGGDLFKGTNDRSAGQLLSAAVRDVSASMEERKSAYFALFSLRGLPVKLWPSPTDFDFPGEVDWAFVDAFAR